MSVFHAASIGRHWTTQKILRMMFDSNRKMPAALERSNESFGCRNTHQEEGVRDFGPHQSRKGLDPIIVCIFSVLNELPFREIMLRPSKAIVLSQRSLIRRR